MSNRAPERSPIFRPGFASEAVTVVAFNPCADPVAQAAVADEDFFLEVAEADLDPRLTQLRFDLVELHMKGRHVVFGGHFFARSAMSPATAVKPFSMSCARSLRVVFFGRGGIVRAARKSATRRQMESFHHSGSSSSQLLSRAVRCDGV
jgi:hypothetical protein